MKHTILAVFRLYPISFDLVPSPRIFKVRTKVDVKAKKLKLSLFTKQ
jgi:hypothetical protein